MRPAASGCIPAEESPSLEAQYRAARDQAVVAATDRHDRLSIAGKDALDLLHRMSTNALVALEPGQGAATVFTTNKGRIRDWVTLHRMPEWVLALCAPGRAESMRAWIDTYTFREQVEVEDWSASHGTVGVYGKKAARLVESIWGAAAAALPLHAVAPVGVSGGNGWLVRTWPLAGEGFLITVPVGLTAAARSALLHASGATAIEASPACLEILRIESGLPASGQELTEEYNPWEARLDDSISLSKGCYIGQEVIARLNTYKKVSRQLVRLSASGERHDLDVVAAGALIRAGGEEAGVVTSAACVPGGRMAALGYVRSVLAVAGRDVVIQRDGQSTGAIIEGAAR